MAWKIEIDKSIQKRIASFLKDKLAKIENPRSIGEALQGELKKFWKYRVGDYRLICSVEDKIVTILVLRVDHRKEVYKKNTLYTTKFSPFALRRPRSGRLEG